VEAAAEATLEEAEPLSAGPTPAKQPDSHQPGPGIDQGPLNELDANGNEGGQLERAEEKEPGKEDGGPAEESGQGSETTELVEEETRVERGPEVASGAHADGPGSKGSEGVLSEGGAVSGGQEGGVGIKSGRWEGWQKAGAKVRVQKGLGYLAGNAQPPGWEQQLEGGREKEREENGESKQQVNDGKRMGTKRKQEGVAKVQPGSASPNEGRGRVGSPQGLQKYLEEEELGEGRKKDPQKAGSAEKREMGSQGERQKEGLEVGEGAKTHAEVAPAKRSAKMHPVEEGPIMMEVEKAGPANRGRLKRVGGAAGMDAGGKRDSLEETGEDDEDDELLAAGGVKKRGQKRAKRRVQIESDEETEEEVGATTTGEERGMEGVEKTGKAQEPERRDSGGAKGPEEERERRREVGGGGESGEVEMGGEEDVPLKQLKGAVKRPHIDDETGEGSDDEVIARLPKSNKRKKGEAQAKRAPPKKLVAAEGKKGKVTKQGGAKDSPNEGGAKAGVGGLGGESGSSRGQAQSAQGAGEEGVKEKGTAEDESLVRKGLETEKGKAAASKMAGGSRVVPARSKKETGKRRKVAGTVEEKGKEEEEGDVPEGIEEGLERGGEKGAPESEKEKPEEEQREVTGAEGAPKQGQGRGSPKEKKEEKQSGFKDEQGPPSGEEALAAPRGAGLAPKRGSGKNALVRAKPKPFVRKVGGGPNRAFRPPGRVNSTRLRQETGKAKRGKDESTESEEGSEGEDSAEKDKCKEAALGKRATPKQASGTGKRRAAEKKESVGMKESTGKEGGTEKKEGAEKDDGAGQGGDMEGATTKPTAKGGQPVLGEGSSHGQVQADSSGSEGELEGGVKRRKGPTKGVGRYKEVEGVPGNEQLEGDSKEGKGEEVRKKGPIKRKSACIQGDDAENGESGGAKKGGKKKRKLASNGTLPVGRRSEGMVTPMKERPGRVSPSRADKKEEEAKREEGEGDQQAAESGGEGEDEVREGVACKDQKAKRPARKEGTATKGKGGVKSIKAGKAVVLGDANKENIAAGGQGAGAVCEGGKGAMVVDSPGREQQKVRYFAFGGTGDQKESMAKKVKVSRPAVEVLNQLIV
jgi:hypothetical protein